MSTPDPMPQAEPMMRGSGRGWLGLAVVLLLAIILPYLLLDDWLLAQGRRLIELAQGRPAATAVGIVALLTADVVLPIPSSLVAVAAGGVLGWGLGAAVIWVGLMAGCGAGYWLGARPGQRLARRVVGSGEVAALGRRFATAGPLLLILARGVPVLAEASVIAAGAARLPLPAFLASTALANAGVAAAYAGIGAAAAGSGSFLVAFTGIAAVPALAWGLWRWRRGLGGR